MNEEKEKIIGRKPMLRCVARTMSIEEANSVAEKYEAEGYETEIIKRKRGEIAIYEIWITGEPRGLFAEKKL